MQNNHNQQYVTFTMNQDLYGLAVTQTREILAQVSVTRVPHSSEDMLGVINLRGQVVPVVDLHLKLKLPVNREGARESCTIITEVDIEDEIHIVGLQVDEVREVLELPKDKIEPAPRLGTSINTCFIKGMGKVNEQFIILLDINRLFSATEMGQFLELGEVSDEAGAELLEV